MQIAYYSLHHREQYLQIALIINIPLFAEWSTYLLVGISVTVAAVAYTSFLTFVWHCIIVFVAGFVVRDLVFLLYLWVLVPELNLPIYILHFFSHFP